MPKLFNIEMDAVTMNDAVATIRGWVHEGNADPNNSGACRYVVTPNVDHAVMYGKRGDLRKAYHGASLVLADGAPLVLASRLFGCQLPERVAGSDLVPALFSAVSQMEKDSANCSPETGQKSKKNGPLTVYLLGAAEGVAERAAKAIHARWPGVRVVGTYSPPLGFEKDEKENAKILRQIAQVAPDVLLVGLGAPKQEVWVAEHRDQIAARAALCVGASIDFLAGHRRRAPKWMQRIGLEWLHRMLSEPRRLTRRYLHDALALPGLFWCQCRGAATA